jgi:hypothetical protein
VSGTDLYVTNNVVAGSGKIGHYTTSGATVNAALFSGQPGGQDDIVVSGTDLFVPHNDIATVGKYTTSGTTVNATLISFPTPYGLAVSGTDLYVTSNNNHVIGKFTTSGATVNAALVSAAFSFNAIEVLGGDLYVVHGSEIGKYTTSGATVNASLITGLIGPLAIAVVPEPSTWGLLLTSAGPFLALCCRIGKARRA